VDAWDLSTGAQDELLGEDLSKLEEPKPDELRAWYEQNKAASRWGVSEFLCVRRLVELAVG
jgi:hypothetical protein